MQRLFSTFADGWPGGGILLQRLLTGAVLLHSVIACLKAAPSYAAITPQIIGFSAGVLLLVGLWTPVAGGMVAIVEIWIALLHPSDAGMPIILATLGVSLAMIGPGAWSIDATLYGRKHIRAPKL